MANDLTAEAANSVLLTLRAKLERQKKALEATTRQIAAWEAYTKAK